MVFTGARDSVYFKINKSLDLFGAMFREISANYVDELDPEDFIRDGMKDMLTNLDPYTVLLDESSSEDIDMLSTGVYTGFGISVGARDSMLTITAVYDGYSAQRNGIRVGDHILQIDTAFVLYEVSKSLRPFTRGVPGSKAVVKILRDGLSDTLTFTLTREEIKIQNLPYYGVVQDSIGYIKLDRFSRQSGEDVKLAIRELRNRADLAGLILDVRDNPGGLLDAATSIAEIFAPKGSKIVSTKGKAMTEERVYTNQSRPSEPDLRLAVLINGRSASASEVLAGAIQDLDRGVILGERSFGKGLVQNVFSLPYNSSIKITTAKYYTPSGRCIQKVDFTGKREGKIATDDSGRVFYTIGNRPVRELHGIEPDSTISEKDYPDVVQQLLEKDIMFGFVSEFTSKFSTIPPKFTVTQEILSQFEQYATRKNFAPQNSVLQKLREAKQIASLDKSNSSLTSKLEVIEKSLQKEQKLLSPANAKVLSSLIENEVYSRFLLGKQQAEREVLTDRLVQSAAQMLVSDVYEVKLAPVER
ncbi:MAG: S41 family peptidase [Ignavibacteria bacterium]|nr:S41 family peptidase [Ignavibacteria bacterium]